MAKTPTRRELESRKKKRQIYEAAMRLFRRYGYEGTTILDIADSSGMSAGSIYNFFGSKEGILDCAIEDIEVVRIPEEEWDKKVQDPFPTLLQYLLDRVRPWEELGADLTVHVSAAYRRQHNDKDGYFCTEEGLGNLPEFIEACQNAGTFDDIVSPEYAANYLLSVLRGVILEWCDFKWAYDLSAKIETALPRVINSFLPYGLRRSDD